MKTIDSLIAEREDAENRANYWEARVEELRALLEKNGLVRRLADALVEQGYSTTRVECDAATLADAVFFRELPYALPGELHSDPPHEYEPEHCAACAAIAEATGDLAQ